MATALCIVLLGLVTEGLFIDVSTVGDNVSGLHINLCNVPVLASAAEQLPIYSFQFSLEKGGTLEGGIAFKVNKTEDDGSAVVTSADVTNSLGGNAIFRQPGHSIQIRSRFTSARGLGNQYTVYQLLQHVYSWLFGPKKEQQPVEATDSNDPLMANSADLDNVYILLLSSAQLEAYMASDYQKQIEASKNKRGYVYNSNIAAEIHVPASAGRFYTKFLYKAKETDRFALFIFNADLKKISIKGMVSFVNPGNDHLPVEMKYYYEVLTFWEVVFILTGILTFNYLTFCCHTTAKMVNYLLAFNFVLVAFYLQLDRYVLLSIKKSGTYSNILWTSVHLLRRLHEIYLRTILILLALGWKVIRDRISEMENRMLITFGVFSCIIGFIEILVNGIDVSRYIINTATFIAILIATNFNTLILQSRLTDEGLNQNAGVSYAIMKSYNIFRLGFFAFVFKPLFYSSFRGICLQLSSERYFVWDEHIMLFLDLMYDHAVYCLCFFAFIPASEIPLFKHVLADSSPNCSEMRSPSH